MAAQGIRAIILDCFGVLYLEKRHNLLQNLPPQKAIELHDIFQQNNYGLLSREEYIAAATGITGQTPEEFERESAEGYQLNEQLVTEIQKLHQQYKIGLLSNIGRGWIDNFLNTHELHDLFDAVVVSGDEGITKPQPRIYQIAAERLSVSTSECIMIDDMADNCAGADAVGMKAVLYASNEQCLAELRSFLA